MQELEDTVATTSMQLQSGSLLHCQLEADLRHYSSEVTVAGPIDVRKSTDGRIETVLDLIGPDQVFRSPFCERVVMFDLRDWRIKLKRRTLCGTEYARTRGKYEARRSSSSKCFEDVSRRCDIASVRFDGIECRPRRVGDRRQMEDVCWPQCAYQLYRTPFGDVLDDRPNTRTKTQVSEERAVMRFLAVDDDDFRAATNESVRKV
jgi:hypothetical protein